MKPSETIEKLQEEIFKAKYGKHYLGDGEGQLKCQLEAVVKYLDSLD